MKKSKTAQERVEEMRRPPSLANWVRLNDRRRDETTLRITRFALAKPRHALAQIYRLVADYVTLGVSAATTRSGINLILDPLVRKLGHEIATALLPWLDKNGIKGLRAFDGMIERYPIGRNITIPVRPTFVYNREGKLTPVFIIGWSSVSLSDFQKRLLATMIQRVILTQEDFEGSDALILFVPRLRFSKSVREVREVWVNKTWLLTDDELRRQFDCYGNALDDAVPIILRELAARKGVAE
ncbi:hypothetical protein [Sphingomonas sp. S2-65]|uniref:hypothetical protein n=1 Tax=Sphingomonas sp. S2-65 TaxID=2903960 RepID=UPI001F1E6A0C|nr:hypothetical protein [Sphingomonas sp. S2-65]UYY59945.1 hypothetical protein LZ586_07630 [Sphingomonas sp. S2-65]